MLIASWLQAPKAKILLSILAAQSSGFVDYQKVEHAPLRTPPRSERSEVWIVACGEMGKNNNKGENNAERLFLSSRKSFINKSYSPSASPARAMKPLTGHPGSPLHCAFNLFPSVFRPRSRPCPPRLSVFPGGGWLPGDPRGRSWWPSVLSHVTDACRSSTAGDGTRLC